MNLFTVMQRFPTHQDCLDYLEAVRWGDDPECPYCTSNDVERKQEKGRQGRWNCHTCTSSFNVLSGTIMEQTRIPLQKWFVALALMINAKKSLSSCQLGRDIELNQKSAWYMQQRIRTAMASEGENELLEGLVEADETFIGGKPRKSNIRAEDKGRSLGRKDSKKVAVLGVVERGGKVKTTVPRDVSGWSIYRFLKSAVNPDVTTLITDEYRAYNSVSGTVPHYVIKHEERYVDDWVHTNTIEGYWAGVKRAWYGTHHHYTREYMPLYLAEASWKYNERKNPNAFRSFMRGLFV